MAIERSWERQEPVLFASDGGQDGLVTLDSVKGFKVKQKVVLSSNTQSEIQLQVKKVISPTQLLVGPLRDNTKPARPNNNLLSRTDISAYTVADGAAIRAPEQTKVKLKPDDIMQGVYEQEPTVALRKVLVDEFGNKLSSTILSNGVSVLNVAQIPDFTEIPVYDNVSIGNTATILRVGIVNYKGRKIMIINPKGKTIFIGWDNTLTAGKNGNGLRLTSNSTIYLSVSDKVDVYAITSNGTASVHVTEGK